MFWPVRMLNRIDGNHPTGSVDFTEIRKVVGATASICTRFDDKFRSKLRYEFLIDPEVEWSFCYLDAPVGRVAPRA